MSDEDGDNFEYLDELLLDLKVVAAIEITDKLCAGIAKLEIHTDSLFSKIKRTLYGETRQDTLDRLDGLLKRVRREVMEFISGRRFNNEILKSLDNHIQNAGVGIHNLLQTYKKGKKDAKCEGRLEGHLETIDSLRSKIRLYFEKQLHKKIV